jgi:hypothetical protein
MTISKEEVARLAAGLSDGEKMIMRRKPETAIQKADWRIVSPTDAAFDLAHRKGLISYFPNDGDPFWMIDEPLGLAVRQFIQEHQQS